MSLKFSMPNWLIPGAIALAWIYAAWYWSLVDRPLHQQRISLLLRALTILLLALAMAGLQWRRPTEDRYVVLCLDESASVAGADRSQVDRFVEEFREVGKGHRLALLPFARRPSSQRDLDATAFSEADRQDTDLESAVVAAIAAIPDGFRPHVVIASDGNETRGDILRAALSRSVPLSTIPIHGEQTPEVQLVEVQGPAEARVGEPFLLHVVIDARQAGTAQIELFRDELPVDLGDAGRAQLSEGENRFAFRQQVDSAATVRWSAQVTAERDTRLDDNQASVTVMVAGYPRLLLLGPDTNETTWLQSALEQQQIQVDTRDLAAMPVDMLQWLEFDAVCLANVPAATFSTVQLQALRSYVEDFGGGLLMLGGDQSFGLGGYGRTPLEPVLPVRCDAEKDQDQPSLAMVIAIDRSGSMGGLKIELAKDAARAAVELLSPRDQLGVIAFDNEPHWIAPLQSAADKAALIDSVNRLDAAGGTNLYPALVAAFDALRTASAKIKHVLILSDGISAPAEDALLIAEMAAEQITVSTIALGDKPDRPRLRALAQQGNGRYYECEDPRSVPQVFVQETMMASQSVIHEEPFLPVALRATSVLRGIDLQSAPALLGYVSTGMKPTSELILGTESGEPLLAWWRYGLGMSLAFTSDAQNRWAADWLLWPDFGPFWAQCVRHVSRKRSSERGEIRVEREGTATRLVLDLIDANNRFIDEAVVRYTPGGTSSDSESFQGAFLQVGPGRYEAILPESFAETQQVLIQAKRDEEVVYQQALSLGGDLPRELRLRPVNEDLLREVARIHGGTFNPTARDVVAAKSPPAFRSEPLTKWLLSSAIVLMLLDLALRRMDRMPGLKIPA